LGVELGNRIGIREADGTDFFVTIVGILDDVQLRDPPPRTIDAAGLRPADDFVSGGIFLSLRASEAIFGRATLTDALVVAPSVARVDALVATLRETFRLEPGIFVIERAGVFGRKVRDFTLSLGFFSVLSTAAAGLAGALAVFLLRDVYADRRQQHAILAALGFSPGRNTLMLMGIGLAVALIGAVAGALLAVACTPKQFGMPSLMADLGTVEPRFDLLIGMIVTALSLGAGCLGVTPVARRLLRTPLAAELAETQG
jgi:ABC-type antimicrobial peptide transport system permease subunit